MAKVWTGPECDERQALLRGGVISILGYGNQGRAQALNLRDRGFQVVVGNQDDRYATEARRDGWEVATLEEAAGRGDYVVVLVPDDVQPSLSGLVEQMTRGQTLCFASGYNLAFGLLTVPEAVDVVMVAPRMIGRSVRSRVAAGEGFPVLVGVFQDASGQAQDYALAYASGIGAGLPGGCAVASSFTEEATLDLFSEQTWAGAITFFLQACFEALMAAGISPEAAILELYASGEIGEIGSAMASRGLFGQLELHSTTSQYGQLTRGPAFVTDTLRQQLRDRLEEIRSGQFAREWTQQSRAAVLGDLLATRASAPLEEAEHQLYRLLGRR